MTPNPCPITPLQSDSEAVAESIATAAAEGGASAQAMSSAIAQALSTGDGSATALSASIAEAYAAVGFGCCAARHLPGPEPPQDSLPECTHPPSRPMHL